MVSCTASLENVGMIDLIRVHVVLGTTNPIAANTTIAVTIPAPIWRRVNNRRAYAMTTATPIRDARSAVLEPEAQTPVANIAKHRPHAAAVFGRSALVTLIAAATGTHSAADAPNAFPSRIVPTARPTLPK